MRLGKRTQIPACGRGRSTGCRARERQRQPDLAAVIERIENPKIGHQQEAICLALDLDYMGRLAVLLRAGLARSEQRGLRPPSRQRIRRRACRITQISVHRAVIGVGDAIDQEVDRASFEQGWRFAIAPHNGTTHRSRWSSDNPT